MSRRCDACVSSLEKISELPFLLTQACRRSGGGQSTPGTHAHHTSHLRQCARADLREKLGLARYGLAQLGTVWLGTVWLGMAWHGMAWLSGLGQAFPLDLLRRRRRGMDDRWVWAGGPLKSDILRRTVTVRSPDLTLTYLTLRYRWRSGRPLARRSLHQRSSAAPVRIRLKRSA